MGAEESDTNRTTSAAANERIGKPGILNNFSIKNYEKVHS